MDWELPGVQPGATVYAAYSTGTLGPLGLTKSGDIVMIMTSHQVGPLKEGATIFLWPEKIPIARLIGKSETKYTKKMERMTRDLNKFLSCGQAPYASSLRIKGIEEDIPIVLKKPIEPQVGRKLIKSGGKTGVTQSEVIGANEEVTVELSDGREAKFADQIKTGYMGTHGDSGSFVLTLDTFEPAGLLFAGDQRVTFHNKLSNISKEMDMDITGFFCPISLPANTPLWLRFIISSIIPDGFFFQKTNLLTEDPEWISKQLGIKEVEVNPAGGFNIIFEDLVLVDAPFHPGDQGSLIFSQDNKVIGLAIGGNADATAVMKSTKLLKPFKLELITNFTRNSLYYVHESGYWRTRCKICSATIVPGSRCRFCGNMTKLFG